MVEMSFVASFEDDKRISNFTRRMLRAEKIILLSLAFLLFSGGALADEGNSQKPEDWDRRLEMLRSVPYISFSEDLVNESDTGVVIYDSEKAYHGYNLYCTRWTGEAFLLDMNGRTVHRWKYLPIGGRGSYHHVDLLKNGDLLVVKEYQSLLRLDWHSKLIWKRELVVHHDVAQASDGSLYTIVREYRPFREMDVWFDIILHLTGKGEEIDRWSAYDHLTELKAILDTRPFLDTVLDSLLAARAREGRGSLEVKQVIAQRPEGFDYFHLNTVSIVPANLSGEKDSRFQQGNLLVCSRHVNQIAMLGKDTYRVLWAWGAGELEWPHHPTMLQNGHILLFDNGVERGYSRVLELDPMTSAIVWEYKTEPPEIFDSKSRGSAQRLPNGNTLICESDDGRVFEVTGEGEVVWMWLNPSTEKGRREGLYRMMRFPSTQVEVLLKRRWWWWRFINRLKKWW
jgi:hypothetical protein